MAVWISILLQFLPLLLEALQKLLSNKKQLSAKDAASLNKALWYMGEVQKSAVKAGCIKGGIAPVLALLALLLLGGVASADNGRPVRVRVRVALAIAACGEQSAQVARPAAPKPLASTPTYYAYPQPAYYTYPQPAAIHYYPAPAPTNCYATGH